MKSKIHLRKFSGESFFAESKVFNELLLKAKKCVIDMLWNSSENNEENEINYLKIILTKLK